MKKGCIEYETVLEVCTSNWIELDLCNDNREWCAGVGIYRLSA